MRYHGIERCSLVNGTGVRAVLWVSGCEHHCKGCHNSYSWDPDGGVPFEETDKKKLIDAISKSWSDGVTFSGGDPLYPANREAITELAKEIKELYPDTSIWMYTGYSWEEIWELEVMRYIDVLVDGEFIEELKDESYKYAGSTNQRIIDVKESLKHGRVKIYF